MGIFRSRNAARFTEGAPAPPEKVAAIDAQIAEIAAVPPPVRTVKQWQRLDELLDERSVIWPLPPLPDDEPVLRPSVPVIPGRPT